VERIFRITSPLVLLLSWELVVRLGWLDARFFPAPSSIVASFADFASTGELAENTLITLQRIVIGFALGAVPGVALGLLMGINRLVRALVEPIVSLLYPIPKIAIYPLILVIFGFDERPKYVTIAIGVFFLMLINTAAGVRQIEPILLDVAKSYRIRPASFYSRVLLPGALVNIFAGIRLSIGVAIILAVAAEFTATKSGIGFTIWNASQTFRIERLYVGLVVISLLGYLLTALGAEAERRVLPWRPAP